jgi:single-strand DNA-binding protein
MDINTCTLTGNIGNDLELRHTPTGTAVLEFNLAVTSGFGDKKKTNWIGLTLWGKTAESAKAHLGKGRKIAVTGRLDQDEWEDKDTGKKRSKTRVIVENWTFADSSKGDHPDRPARREESAPARGQASQPELPVGGDDSDDVIPFAPFEKHAPLPL